LVGRPPVKSILGGDAETSIVVGSRWVAWPSTSFPAFGLATPVGKNSVEDIAQRTYLNVI
jgi:hypothetical protein